MFGTSETISVKERRIMAVVLAVIMAASAVILLSPTSDAAEGDVEYDGEITLYGYNVTMGLQNPSQVETVEWDFGDGSETVTVEITASNANGEVTHKYEKIGDYTVTATMRNTYMEGGEQHDGETVLTYLYHIMGFPTITFDSNGGTDVDSITGTKSTFKATAPEAPTKEGYTFTGWYTDKTCTTLFDWNTTVVRHITLYAGWEPVTYTVHFDLNGGEGSIEDVTVEHGKTIAIPDVPIRENYNFEGWYYNGEAWSFSTPVTSNMTLIAQWESIDDGKVYYVVTFNANGGTAEYSQKSIIPGNSVILPEATRDGYTLEGWYSGDTRIGVAGDSVIVNSNITYTAHWTPNTYTVQFDLDGGVGDVEDVEVQHGKTITEPTAPTKEGYYFAGWYFNGAAWDFKSPVTSDMTLIAHWTEEAVEPAPGPDDEQGGNDDGDDGFPLWMILAIVTVVLAIIAAVAYFLNFPYIFILTAISAVATVVCYIMEL